MEQPEIIYRFEELEFHARTFELKRRGEPVIVPLPARTALACLLELRARNVSRDELMRRIWHDSVVSEGSLRLAICELRQALGDTGKHQRFVQTVRGSGYRFIAPCTVETRTTGLDGAPPSLASRLIGRSSELQQLVEQLRLAHQSGRACVVQGGAGVGKSLLARTLVEQAADGDVLAVWGHGEQEGGAALGPWLEMARQLLDLTGRFEQSFAQLSPALSRALGHEHGVAPADAELRPEQQRAQLFHELTRLFSTLSLQRPLFLLLEDLHWADEASLSFFTHFSRHLPRARVLLLVTVRTQREKHERGLTRALQSCLREPYNLSLSLQNLTVGDTAQMLDVSHDDALAREVHALTHGNPLLTLELARVLKEPGALTARRIAPDQVEIRTLLAQRMSKLDGDAREALSAASVLGLSFSLAELAGALTQTADLTLQTVDTCLEHGFLCAQDETRFAFTHPLVRDAAYADLRQQQRAAVHKRAALWLEAQTAGSPTPARLSLLAHHFHQAAALGVAERAVHYLTRAAEASLDATAYADAVRSYDQALACTELVAHFSPAARLVLQIDRAKAQRAAGTPWMQVKETLALLAEEAQQLGEPELFVRAVLAYTGQSQNDFVPSRFAGSMESREIELLSRALTMAGEGASSARVLLLCSLAYALISSVDGARRTAVCEEAVALARTLQLPWLLARALRVRAYAAASPSQHALRLQSCDELLEVARQHGLKEAELEARITRAVCLLEVCDVPAARGEELWAQQLASELNVPRLTVRTELLALFRAFGDGNLSEIARLTQRCRDADPDHLVANALFVVRSAGLLVLQNGTTEQSLALHENLLKSFPDTPGFRCCLASDYAAIGRAEEARQQFDWVARDDFASLAFDIHWLSQMSLLADAAAVLDDAKRARLVFERLAPFGERWMFAAAEGLPMGPVAYWLGELCVAMREADLGEYWLARARVAAEKQGAALFLAHTSLAEANLLVTCRPERGLARPLRLLEEIEAFAEPRGLSLLHKHALRLRQRCTVRSYRDLSRALSAR